MQHAAERQLGLFSRPCTRIALGAILLVLGACRSDRLGLPTDTTKPAFQIVAPHDTFYDLDSNKLVDVSIIWRDSAGSVDPASAKLRSLRKPSGSADTTTNLLDVWNVVRRDTGGVLVRETINNLLPDGQNLLEISVSDTAGNRRVDTLIFVVPHVSLFATIQTGVVATSGNINDLIIDSVGTIGLATASRNLVVFDPESLRLVKVIPVPGASDLQAVVFDGRSRIAYASEGRIQRFDLNTNTLLGPISSSFSTVAMAFSRTTPSLLYAGEAFAGWLGYIDLSTSTRTDEIRLPHTNNEFIFDIIALRGDRKLYLTRYDEGGILVVDPRTKQVLKHVTIAGSDLFITDKMTLSHDEQHVYVALRDANPRGIGDLDTSLDSIVRVLDLALYVPGELALSPSQRRLFVTTQDRFPNLPSRNVVIDVPSWTIIEELDRPHAAGAIRRDGPVAFRPDGKLFFE